MIAAPITKKADSVTDLGSAKVWLPNGKFIDFFTGDVYKGNRKYTVYRPLEQMPLFCKSGAIIPMQKHIKKDNQLGSSNALEIVVCAGADGNFTLYEDDGKTLRYQNGDFATTDFVFKWNGESAVFTKKATCGNLSLIPENREYKLIFKGFKNGCKFYVGKKDVPAIYSAESHAYTLEPFTCNIRGELIITIVAESNMLYENESAYDRIIDILTRCQCAFKDKNNWLNIVDKVIAEPKHEYISEFANSSNNNIAGAIMEQLLLLGIEL